MDSGRELLRLGIVGLGVMGGGYGKNILRGDVPNCRLSAVCDVNGVLEASYPGAKIFVDPEAMFRSGEIDAVIIATPHYSHTTLGIAALEAGLHVLVEKPISVHKGDCERLLAAHRDESQKFAAMFNMRTRPLFQKLKQLIEGGELGEIRRIQWTITDWFRTQAYYAAGSWRGTWKGEGGGVLINQCPHQLDLWQWLFGMPSRIYAQCQLGRYHNIEVEDDVTAQFQYPNGCTGVFVTSTGESPGVNRLEIVGELGLMKVEEGRVFFHRNETSMTEFSHATPELMGVRPSFEKTEILTTSAETLSDRMQIIRNFVYSIKGKEELVAPAKDGIYSVEIGNAMLLSSIQKRPIDLPIDSGAFELELQKLIAGSH